jgi:hypothetical protein
MWYRIAAPAALLISMVFVPPAASAQVVLGRVVDDATAAPVAAASITLHDGAGREVGRVITDRSGRFAIEAESPGRHTLQSTAVGYHDVTTTGLHLESNRLLEVELRLSPGAMEIERIVVTVTPRLGSLARVGFYERQRFGFGRFIDRNAIEERGAVRTLDLLAGIAGVRIGYTRDGNRYVQMRGAMGMSGMCSPTVYLDGMPVKWFDLDRDIRPYDLDGVEVYRGTAGTPMQFSGGPPCGAIVLWSRR